MARDLIVTFRGRSTRFGSNPTLRVPARQRKEILNRLQRQGLQIIRSFTASGIRGGIATKVALRDFARSRPERQETSRRIALEEQQRQQSISQAERNRIAREVRAEQVTRAPTPVTPAPTRRPPTRLEQAARQTIIPGQEAAVRARLQREAQAIQPSFVQRVRALPTGIQDVRAEPEQVSAIILSGRRAPQFEVDQGTIRGRLPIDRRIPFDKKISFAEPIVGKLEPAPPRKKGFEGLISQFILDFQRLTGLPSERTQELRGEFALAGVLPVAGIPSLITQRALKGRAEEIIRRAAGERELTRAERAQLFAFETALPLGAGLLGGFGLPKVFGKIGTLTAKKTVITKAITEPGVTIEAPTPSGQIQRITQFQTKALSKVQEKPFFGLGAPKESIIGIKAVTDITGLSKVKTTRGRTQFIGEIKGEPGAFKGGLQEITTIGKSLKAKTGRDIFATIGKGEVITSRTGRIAKGVFGTEKITGFRGAGLSTRIARTPKVDVFESFGITGRPIRQISVKQPTTQFGRTIVIRQPIQPFDNIVRSGKVIGKRGLGGRPIISQKGIEDIAKSIVVARPTTPTPIPVSTRRLSGASLVPSSQRGDLISELTNQQVGFIQPGRQIELQTGIQLQEDFLSSIQLPFTKTKQRTRLKQTITPISLTKTLQRQAPLTKQTQQLFLNQRALTRQVLRQTGATITTTRQIQSRVQRQVPFLPLVTTPFIVGGRPRGFGFPIFPPFGFPFGGGGNGRPRRRAPIRQQIKTLPSFSAILLGRIGGKLPRGRPGRPLSGIEQRLIPEKLARQLGLIDMEDMFGPRLRRRKTKNVKRRKKQKKGRR